MLTKLALYASVSSLALLFNTKFLFAGTGPLRVEFLTVMVEGPPHATSSSRLENWKQQHIVKSYRVSNSHCRSCHVQLTHSSRQSATHTFKQAVSNSYIQAGSQQLTLQRLCSIQLTQSSRQSKKLHC